LAFGQDGEVKVRL